MRIAYFILMMAFILIALIFKKIQSKNKMGGNIALAKSLWLSYTILTWFTLPILFQFDDSLGQSFKRLMLIFTLSMWTRGVIELILLFKFKNWKPKYGISHNIFTIVLFSLSFFILFPITKFEVLFAGAIILGLMLETYYAFFFHKNLGVKTEGETPIWFANEDDKSFRVNLFVTTIGNMILYSINFIFLVLLH